jgi:hypothetical protein
VVCFGRWEAELLEDALHVFLDRTRRYDEVRCDRGVRSTLRHQAEHFARPKVMTAYMTMHTLAGPVGLALAGPLVQAFGLKPVFVAIAVTFTLGAGVLALVLARRGREKAAAVESVPTAA